MEGSTVMWRCHAQGEPGGDSLRYAWFAGDTEIAFANLALRAQLVVRALSALSALSFQSSSHASPFQGSHLRINGVRREDRGWYRCQASNGFGEPASAAAYLDVHYEAEGDSTPDLSYQSPHLMAP